MSNSELATYVKISPNRTSPRKHNIDTITIHCMAGDLSVEALGDLFALKSRNASSNYGISTDGHIAQYVDEGDRSWCSSNKENDERAVTIEVANDGDAETGWHVSDKAMEALVYLCVDICKRNGIRKLLWKNDKSLIGQVDKQNMTVHRWFANKACPGDYLMNKMGSIASAVNVRLSDQPQKPEVNVSADRFIWDFLTGKGLSEVAAAGVMGNLYAESRLNPCNLQNSFEKKLGLTDQQYTSGVDDGTYTNFVKDSAGYGLAQWTFWTRKQNLLNYARTQKKSIGDLQMQLEFLWSELNGYKAVMEALENAQSVFQASNAVLLGYEKPADQGAAVQKKRAEYGQTFMNLYGHLGTGYLVRITADILNIRSGAGTAFSIVGTVKKGQVYTIMSEKDGWGKLKSGIGWIKLSYTERV